MRTTAHLMMCAGLLAIALPASADDADSLPPAPTMTNPSPSFTYPAPMGSSSGNGVIINGDASPPVIHGGPAPTVSPQRTAPPADEHESSSMQYGFKTVPLGKSRSSRGPGYARDSRLASFQASTYWTPAQPFHPAGAPDYSEGLAGAGGTHVRYPYFKYRAPWTYQGPAGISHTIEW